MIVMITDEQVFAAHHVCQNCLMSDQSGLPRWQDESTPLPQEGNLRCGIALQQANGRAKKYRCQMGFELTQVR